MDVDVLKAIGLSQGEIRIYYALIDLGSAPVSRIHERTGIERRNIYDILNKLIERGLVTYINENKRRFFRVAHPSAILSYVEQQEEELERTKEEISAHIPALIAQFQATKPDIDAQVFRGPEGIKATWEDMLNYESIHWIGSGGYVPRSLPRFFRSWDRRREKKRIRQRHLYREEYRNDLPKMGAFVSVRFLPKAFSGNPAAICIWGDKVGNFMLGKEMFAFVIESRELAENHLRYFDYLWKNVAKP